MVYPGPGSAAVLVWGEPPWMMSMDGSVRNNKVSS